jgi:diguanylate cyclase (GGDEF)-like protein
MGMEGSPLARLTGFDGADGESYSAHIVSVGTSGAGGRGAPGVLGAVGLLPRMLFIDDEPEVVRAFARAVRGRFELDTTSDPEEALVLGRERDYAVVATDLNMPKCTGLDVVDWFRSERPLTSLVLVTGVENLDLSAHLESARHISGVVRKPWSNEHLVETLDRAAELYHARRAPNATKPMRVLLVEDCNADAILTTRVLEREGYVVERQAQLRGAELALRSRAFDIVLTDLSLPDACGLDAVSTLRCACPEVPIVVMTGARDDALARQATQAGAQGYHLKDGDFSSLNIAIHCAVQRRALEAELCALALQDPLTGLANRNALSAAFRRCQASAERRGSSLNLFLIDLDQFKQVNDRYGHLVGDELLRGVANRLTNAVRTCDLVARVGGDEFVVLAEDISSDSEEESLRRRIVEALERPIAAGEHEIVARASVGSARFPDQRSLEDLVRLADESMYAHKSVRRRALSATDTARY